MQSLPRPLQVGRAVETAAYLVLAVMSRISADTVFGIFSDPISLIADELGQFSQSEVATVWREEIVIPVLDRVQNELRDVCANDCVRVSSRPHAFGLPMLGRRYWRRFGLGESADDSLVILEKTGAPCVVGLPLDENHGCPVNGEAELTAGRIDELRRIVEFRRQFPDNQTFAHRRTSK
jgi:hypothetical protein